MAVLNNIRKHGIFLIVIIAMALFAFVLADVIRQGGFSMGQNQNEVGSINGEGISNVDFDNRVQAIRQNYPAGVSSTMITNQAWDATVKQTLLQEQIKKSGIAVGSQQLSSALARQFGQNAEFTTNGQFDVNKFKSYLEQLKAINPQMYYQWLQNEDQVVNQVKVETYFDLLQAGAGVTPKEAEEIYKLNNTKFDLDFVKIPFGAVDNDAVTVSDNDIQAYIDDHKKDFETDGLRDIRYVLFAEKPTAEDEAAVKEDLEKLLGDHKIYNQAADMEETEKGFKNITDYDSFLEENSDIPFEDTFLFKSELPKDVADTLFSLSVGDAFGPYKDDGYWKYSKVIEDSKMPDSVELKHILISYQGLQTGQNTNRTEAEAEQLADSLLAVVQKDPDEFSALVEKYSDDTGTKEKEGDLGWIPHAPGEQNDFIDFAFNNKPGSTKVIHTQYGFHIASITDAKDRERVIKLATLAKEIQPSDNTLNELFNQATKFQLGAKDGDFSAKAKENGYDVKVAKNLNPLDENLPGIGARRNIVKWAFDKDHKTGDISRFDTDLGYVVAQITSATTKGIKNVEEARAEVTPILQRKKKGEFLKDNIELTDLKDIASAYGVQVQEKQEVSMEDPNIDGKEPRVVGAAFGLEKGKLSKPIVGKTGVYVIQVKERKDPEAPESYQDVLIEENQKQAAQSSQKIFDALENKAEITQRLAEFY